jgi:hypothetical protein
VSWIVKMDVSMAPPVLPGFSLRVQLFSPNAYGAGDRPIRCFRVVTSPDVTIREFCQEASRIHKINYGESVITVLGMQPADADHLSVQTHCDQEMPR